MTKKKKKRGKKVRDYTPTRHHVTPSSRGGSSKLENIAMVANINHQNYHTLFDNKTPGEIIQYLVEDYWKGNWRYVIDAYKKYNG